MRIKYIIIVIVLIIILTIGCTNKIKGDLIIQNISIVNIKNGKVDGANDVIIQGERIVAIIKHKNNQQYVTTRVIDGSGLYLIPGLWDMHTHTWWGYKDFFPLLLANGVTGIREMFGDIGNVNKIRNEIIKGEIIGPEIVTSGPIVDGKPVVWPGSDEADTPESGREIVRNQKASGVDFIKVYNLLKREVYFAIADECKKQQIPFNGHIPRAVTLEEAVEAGHQSIEHSIGILQFCSDKRDYYYAVQRGEIEDTTLVGPGNSGNRMAFIVSSFDEKKVDELIDLLSKSNTWICPTSTVNRAFGYLNDPEFRNDDRIHYIPDYVITQWDPAQNIFFAQLSDEDYQVYREKYKLELSIMKKMLDGGCKFLAGTDYPNPYCFPGFSLHDELEIFVDKAGFTPLEALQTATIKPAIFLKRTNDYGTVEKGKIASLVLLKDNPLEDISNTRKIVSVIIKGKVLKGDSLRSGLEQIAKKNRLPKIREEICPIIIKNGVEAGINRYRELKKKSPDGYNFDENQLISLGYQLLTWGHVEDAIKIFSLNVEMYPDYDNGFDSLGDAYIANHDTMYAIAAYEKAISLGMEITKSKLEALKNGKSNQSPYE